MTDRWVAWNAGHGWSIYHRSITAQPVRTICAHAISERARVTWTANPPPEQQCQKCLSLLVRKELS